MSSRGHASWVGGFEQIVAEGGREPSSIFTVKVGRVVPNGDLSAVKRELSDAFAAGQSEAASHVRAATGGFGADAGKIRSRIAELESQAKDLERDARRADEHARKAVRLGALAGDPVGVQVDDVEPHQARRDYSRADAARLREQAEMLRDELKVAEQTDQRKRSEAAVAVKRDMVATARAEARALQDEIADFVWSKLERLQHLRGIVDAAGGV